MSAALRVYPPSDTSHHTHTPHPLFSPIPHRTGYAPSTTYSDFSQTTQSPPLSPIKFPAPQPSTYTPRTLPPATDSLINPDPEKQPSLTARLHRRKKTYQGPTAPATSYSQPRDPLRAARLAWRAQEEYAEQVRAEEEHLRETSAAKRQQKLEKEQFAQRAGRAAGVAPVKRPMKKKARSKWTAFVVWIQLSLYRFTRGMKNLFH
jgi:hypothetical protein